VWRVQTLSAEAFLSSAFMLAAGDHLKSTLRLL
jgi:hypothetical protein